MSDDIFTQEDQAFSRSLKEASDWASTTQFISGKGSILNGSISQPEESAVLTPEALKQALEGIQNWHYTAELVPCKYRVRVWCRICLGEDPRGLFVCFGGGTYFLPDPFPTIQKAVEAGEGWIEGCPQWEYQILDQYGNSIIVSSEAAL